MVGYKSEKVLDVLINENTTLDMMLEPSVIQSEQVIVTAGKYEQKVSELPVSAEIIPSDDFSVKNFYSLEDAMRYVPGLNMIEDQLSIRGSSGYGRGAGTRVLLAIDGIPFYTGDTGEIIWEIIPVNDIERVEIIKGAASSLYGSSAIGGVINVITKEIPDKPLTLIKTNFGLWDKPFHKEWDWSDNYRTFNGITLSHSNKFDNLGFSISLSRLQDLSYKQSGFFTRYIGYIKGEYEFSPSLTATLFANGLTHSSGNFIYWKDLKNALVPPDTDQGQRTEADRYMIGVIIKNILSSKFFVNVKASYYRTKWRDETESRNNSLTGIYHGEIQTNYFASNNLTITSGIEASYSNVNSNIFGKPSSNGIGIYSQGDIKFNFPLTLSIGIRYDYSKLDSIEGFSDLSPKVGLNYNLNDYIILRAAFGSGFRAPSLAEAFTSTTASGITVKPNLDLKPETNLSFEAGINYSPSELLTFDAAIFQNEFYDFIVPSIDPKDGLVFFNNVTRARIQGFEIGTDFYLSENFRFNLSYTFLWSRDIERKNALKYRPRHMGIASAVYSILNIETGIDFRYFSRFDEIDNELVELGLVPDGDKRVDSYVVDLRAGYNFISSGAPLRIFFNAKNIFNYNYVELIGNIAPIRNYSISAELLF
jgi:iron complex outermembrane receptor protein